MKPEITTDDARLAALSAQVEELQRQLDGALALPAPLPRFQAGLMERIEAAGPNGLSRTQIYEGYGRNKRAREITQAVDALKREGRIVVRKLRNTGGRPAIIVNANPVEPKKSWCPVPVVVADTAPATTDVTSGKGPVPELVAIARRIRAQMAARGWKTEHLAVQTGVPFATLATYLTDKPAEMKVSRLALIAKALDCSADELLGHVAA